MEALRVSVEPSTSSASFKTRTTPSPPPNRVSVDYLQYPPGFLRVVPDLIVTNENNNENIVDAMEYLTNILSSKVYDVAIESPLELATKLSEQLGVFSFKLRGAYNMMAKLPREQLDRGVICSSAANHAQGVALAAKELNCSAVIAMLVTTPEIKWKSVERLSATVVLIGDSYDEAQTYAKKQAQEEGRSFIPPFDHPNVIIEQGTVGMEIMRQTKSSFIFRALLFIFAQEFFHLVPRKPFLPSFSFSALLEFQGRTLLDL
ncbi:hypothetical protein L3X38_016437 [Prunus dulcis]|uniref:Tryptophan synthase beta chain-like PALP domain-containing protein n=1 Tax=Prunus dulcis TaxID=3755 RepID=A0AAD4W6A6_PRUDU|nr:hypothetical protein L3X38_016437 [Prunus dulcis]